MKKHTPIFAIALALAVMLSACGGEQSSAAPTATPEPTVYSTPSPTPTPEPTPEPTPTPEPEVSCASHTELRDYLWQQREAGETEISYYYTGEDVPSVRNVAQILDAYFIHIDSDREQHYNLTIWLYPGERIVQAWRSGDESSLSEDEKAAYSKALEVVEAAKSTAASDIELELALHDWLCENVTYVETSTEVDIEVLNRPLTAVGALLDGEANCQGYTDAFYLLGTLAGFEVSRLHVNDVNGDHVTNTINMDGAWYIVDVTYDDGEYRNYRMFNAGRDEVEEYSWDEEFEYYPIAQSGGALYYYNFGLDSYEKNYYSVDSMADGVLSAWYDRGYSEQHVRLIGTSADWSALSDAIYSHAISRGIHCSWYIWAYSTDTNTYYTVTLS